MVNQAGPMKTLNDKNQFSFDVIPFDHLSSRRFLFPSAALENAWRELRGYLYGNCRCVVLSGAPGSGKTTVLNQLIQDRENIVDYISIAEADPAKLDFPQLIRLTAEFLYLNGNDEKLLGQLFNHVIRQRLQGVPTVLIIEQAERLEPAVLAQLIAAIMNYQNDELWLQLLLVGAPELEERVLAAAEPNPAIADYVKSLRLLPLSPKESYAYVQHQFKAAGVALDSRLFNRETIAAIIAHGEGNPRKINALCNEILQVAEHGTAPHWLEPTAAAVEDDTVILPPPEQADVAPAPAEPASPFDSAAEAAPAGAEEKPSIVAPLIADQGLPRSRQTFYWLTALAATIAVFVSGGLVFQYADPQVFQPRASIATPVADENTQQQEEILRLSQQLQRSESINAVLRQRLANLSEPAVEKTAPSPGRAKTEVAVLTRLPVAATTADPIDDRGKEQFRPPPEVQAQPAGPALVDIEALDDPKQLTLGQRLALWLDAEPTMNPDHRRQAQLKIAALQKTLSNSVHVKQETDFVTCEDVQDWQAVNIKRRFAPGKVALLAKVAAPRAEKLWISWQTRGGQVIKKYSLRVQRGGPAGKRIYVWKRIDKPGPYEVRLYNQDQQLIGRREFTVVSS